MYKNTRCKLLIPGSYLT